MGFLLLSLLVVALCVFYKWSTRNLNYWKIRKVPYIKSIPLLGSYSDVILGKINISEQYKLFYEQMKNVKYFGILIGTYPALVPKDPELIMRILVKDFRHFYDRGFHVADDDYLGNSMFFMRNPKWRLLRSKTVPVFSNAKLKSSFQIIDQSTDELIEFLNGINQESIQTRKLMGDAMTDVVCKAICGVQIHSIRNPNKEYIDMQSRVFAASFRAQTRNILNFCSPYLAKKIHNFDPKLYSYFTKLTWQTIELRKEKNIKRNDLLQLLYEIYEEEMKKPSENRSLDKNDITSTVFIMILAGFETSTSTSSLVLHELAYNLEIQDKVREEIHNVTEESGGKIKYEDLNKLKFLEQVILETLRLYPLVNTIFRECTEDYNVPGTDLVIEKGDFIHVPTLALHTDPAFWKNPGIFDPERFSDENISLIVPGSYLPFGDGPRICIGKRFAFIQLKLLLSKILLHYQVSPCEKSTRNHPLTINSQLSVPEGEFWLTFTKLEKCSV